MSPQVSSQALDLIDHAVADAIATFGGTDALAVVVHCSLDDYVEASNRSPEDVRQRFSGGLPAQVLKGDIWIYGPNFDRPSLNQRRVVYHEYFHALQRFLSAGRSGDSPLWLVEGTARYFEFSVAPGDLDSFRRTQLRRWSDLPPLAALEQTGGGKAVGGDGEAYSVGSVASQYLVAKYGRDRLQHDFWVTLAETDWRSAFMRVFGVPVDAFYTEFEEYRSTLRP